MTMDEIREALRARKMHNTLSVLERAVDDEARELMTFRKRTRGNVKSCSREAEEYYAGDISSYLSDPRPLRPDDILAHRRKPTAWAIAELMREYGAAE